MFRVFASRSAIALAGLWLFFFHADPAAAKSAPGQPPPRPAGSAPLPPGPTFDWAPFDSLLSHYVKEGRVDYATWKSNGVKPLEALLKEVAGWKSYAQASKPEQLVFLVNAYNAFVVQQVLAKYPIASVKDLPGFFDRTKHPLPDGNYTLDEIEKTLIRPLTGEDPAYHMALVCGSRGSPNLRPFAYRAEAWEPTINQQTRDFIADTTKVQLVVEPYALHVSELFHRNINDYEKGDTTLPRWIGPYMSLGIVMKMSASEPPIEYIPFDWALNDRPAPAEK